ncbi:MAG: Zn-dependent hydrolase of the beta-lactamase fold-like protein [uncultured bacterium]|nr:MAG: Zn-dependent hydrolase of the beta-lactamase fold-like protein [uncultured bacterium]
MEISYLGHSAFKIKGKSATVVTDPYSHSMVGLKLSKVEADIVTVSHNHDDHNAIDAVDAATGRVKKTIIGPGEYDIQGVSVMGYPTFHDEAKGQLRGKNTVYVIYIDGFSLCHLGDLGHTLDEQTINELGNIDILFVPVGGYYTLDAEKAVEVVHSIEPKVIIPMHYKVEGMAPDLASKLAGVDVFLSKAGLHTENFEKYTLKSVADLPMEELIALLAKR